MRESIKVRALFFRCKIRHLLIERWQGTAEDEKRPLGQQTLARGKRTECNAAETLTWYGDYLKRVRHARMPSQ